MIYFVCFVIGYKMEKKKNHSGKLEINEKGISDTSDSGMTIAVDWNRVELAVIKKHTITFVTNTLIVFFVNIELKEDIIKALNKYNPNLNIIDFKETGEE